MLLLIFASLLAAVVAAAAGNWLAWRLAGPAPAEAPSVGADLAENQAARQAALERARAASAAAWENRLECESRAGGVFVSCMLVTAAVVLYSLLIVFGSVGGGPLVTLLVTSAFVWSAFSGMRQAAEEKRQTALRADAVVERLERVEDEAKGRPTVR